MKKSDILVAIIMGSKTDWPTMKHAALMLDKLKIKYESKIVSAHRTPDLLYEFAESAESRGIEVRNPLLFLFHKLLFENQLIISSYLQTHSPYNQSHGLHPSICNRKGGL